MFDTPSARQATRSEPQIPKLDTGAGIEYLARFGYAAKGVVYGTIGVLAVMTAVGFRGGRIVGTRSAIETLRTQPFGQVLAWTIVCGLAGYVVWRAVQAFLDPEHKGSDVRGLAKRTGLALSGASYASLAFFTASSLLGGPTGGDEDANTRESAATLMQHEYGVWLVGAAGFVFFTICAFQFHKAYSLAFRSDWKVGEMEPRTLEWATRLSRFGIARATAFGLIGWFLLRAAREADASEAAGLGGALQSFAEGDLGGAWLAVIGTGFACYGVYCLVNARFRRISP